jgi:hypothetical protein
MESTASLTCKQGMALKKSFIGCSKAENKNNTRINP